MDFSEALIELKKGKRLYRKGWKGQDVFIFIVPGKRFRITGEQQLSKYFPLNASKNYRLRIDIHDEHGHLSPWYIGQNDVLSDDWEIFDAILDYGQKL